MSRILSFPVEAFGDITGLKRTRRLNEEEFVVSVDRGLCVFNIWNAVNVSYTSRGG